MKKKKILIVNVADDFGGAEKSLVDVLELLNKNENLSLKVLAEDLRLQSLLKNKGINYSVFRFGKFKKNIYTIIKLLINWFKIGIEIIKYKPDLVISNTDLSHILISFPCFILNKKFIWILRDYHLNKIIKKIFEKHVSLIICVSQHLKNYYNGNEKYFVIPNGIDIENCNNYKLRKYRVLYNIDDNEVVFGIACRFVRWKGLDELLDAFALASHQDIFNGRLLIAGSAKEETLEHKYFIKLVKKVINLNLQNKIHFVGWVDDVLEFYCNCDVVVSNSLTAYGGPESFGRAIIEAWKVKKPVITTDCGGPKYIVKDGVNGIKVREGDILELSKALIYLAANKNIREILAINGYRELCNKYDIRRVAKSYYYLLTKF